jgi:YidC/Oxa1 family membrane protein insertase
LEGEIHTERVEKLDDIETLPGRGVSWVGLEDTHFVSVFLPRSGVAEALLQPVAMQPAGEATQSSVANGAVRIVVPFDHEEGVEKEIKALPRDARWILRAAGPELAMDAYFGPKEFEILKGLGHDLEKTVEWGGVLRHVVRPLLAGLKWLHANLVPNYGWAIVLMTIGLKVVLFPLTHKSFVSMQKMQKLQPQMKAIRQRYKGKMRDKRGKMDLEVQRKMNEEMQELFRSEGASPTGGCLPILLQMPIFFAFFRLLSTAVELRHEPWVLWVKDLSSPDPLFVLPVLMGVTQILQQKLTPAAGDPMQRKIMQLFPWMFMIFSLSFPSGLVLYWTVNNVFTIAQTATYKKWRERKDAEEKLLGKTRKANKGERKKR